MNTPIAFEVTGEPVPQGSTRAFAKSGKVFITNDPQGTLARWRADIRAACRAVRPADAHTLEGPLTVELSFRFRRPASHRTKSGLAASAPAYPRHDIDKLIRAVLDALTGIAWIDDSQVTAVHATKAYFLDLPSGLGVEISGGTWE